MPPSVNKHSTSKGNNEDQLSKFNVPMIPGDNYGLIIYKNNHRIIATLLNNKVSQF